MGVTDRIRRVIAAGAVVAAAGCGEATMPSPPPAGPLQLAGVWTGTLFHPGSGTGGVPMQVRWTATQVGTVVSGPHTITRPDSGLVITGTLTGTLSGSEMALTQTVLRGGVSGFPNCAIVAAGQFTPTERSISGVLQTSFAGCDGFNMFANGAVPAQLALTRQ